MMPNQICVIGALGLKSDAQAADGQVVKTRELYALLQQCYGPERVVAVDTLGWSRRIPAVLWDLVHKVRASDVLIMLPAQNGVQVFSRLLLLLKKPGTRLFYDVIGGWLPGIIEKTPGISASLQQFDGIWVETTWMARTMARQGFSNVSVVPNFKRLQILDSAELCGAGERPLRLCTFSRVMREKGIEDAIDAVSSINQAHGTTVYTLDIYGRVDGGYAERFGKLRKSFPDFVRYMGVAKPEESVSVLKGYFALLFPTRFYTEGIPGTLIDSYCAGVPVICSRWQSSRDILEDGVTGLGYAFDRPEELAELLEQLQAAPETILAMKPACLKKAADFQPERAARLITGLIEEDRK